MGSEDFYVVMLFSAGGQSPPALTGCRSGGAGANTHGLHCVASALGMGRNLLIAMGHAGLYFEGTTSCTLTCILRIISICT